MINHAPLKYFYLVQSKARQGEPFRQGEEMELQKLNKYLMGRLQFHMISYVYHMNALKLKLRYFITIQITEF